MFKFDFKNKIYPEMRSLTPVAAAAVEEGARRGDFIDVFKREGFDDGCDFPTFKKLNILI